MTVLDHAPRPTYAVRRHRRHEIVTVGGIEGVLRVVAALHACGLPVRDFAVDVRDGVPCSSVTCTLSVSDAESATFAERLGALPSVVSVEPC